LINKHKNEDNKTIEFDKINKVIEYKKDENLTRLLKYLTDLGENTEILPDFTYLSKANTNLSRKYQRHIVDKKGQLLRSGTSVFSEF
jgi:hypothetical protein